MPRNFGLLLAQGSCYTAAIQLTSAATVLPYISTEIGAPTIAIALVYPVFFAGFLLGSIYSARFLRWVVSTTALLGGIALLQALLTGMTASSVTFLPVPLSAYFIIVLAGIIGVLGGFSKVGTPLAITALVSGERRSDLMLRRTAVAALVVMAVSAYSVHVLSDGSKLEDVNMLWLSMLVMTFAAIAASAVRPPAELGQARSASLRTTLAEGFSYIRQQPWILRYLLTQLIFTAITLGPMFYGIYISATLGLYNGCLDGVLLYIGYGLFAGTVVWTFVRRRFGIAGLYVGSAAISLAAGTLCIVSLTYDLLPHMLTFEFVIALAAMANQAIAPAALDWIYKKTTDDVRVLVISFSQFVVGVASMLVALVLGMVARQAPATWPLVVLILGTGLSALAATRVPRLVRGAPQ